MEVSAKMNECSTTEPTLDPVRVTDYSEFAAVNYHRWPICDTACTLGEQLKVPVYQFVKEALIRKFGQDWFDGLDAIAQKNQPRSI